MANFHCNSTADIIDFPFLQLSVLFHHGPNAVGHVGNVFKLELSKPNMKMELDFVRLKEEVMILENVLVTLELG